MYVGVYADRTPDWLVWQRDNLIGSFDGREIASRRRASTGPSANRQELRLKLQAIGLSADLRQAYRVEPAATPCRRDEPVDDFSVRNLGVQIRYRYELAPLSYLYVVYGRGGFEQDAERRWRRRPAARQLQLRDDEQLLVKFSYRFEN